MKTIRKSIFFRIIAAYAGIAHLAQIIFPTAALALTSGPVQPEAQAYQQVSVSDLVDPFTGTFNYTIPLASVDGEPISISYNTAIGADDEASTVGLGWILNAGGAIVRNIQALPDDFKGDLVHKEFNMKPNRTFGLSATASSKEWEIFGFTLGKLKGKGNLSGSITLGAFYNNRTGLGMEASIDPTLSISKASKDDGLIGLTPAIGYNSNSGLGINPQISFSHSKKIKTKEGVQLKSKFTGGIGMTFNSRAGLKSLNLKVKETLKAPGVKKGDKLKHMNYNGLVSAKISFSSPSVSPQLSLPFGSFNISGNLKTGIELTSFFPNLTFSGYYSEQSLMKNEGTASAFGHAYLEHAPRDRKETTDMLMDKQSELDGPYMQKATPNIFITRPAYDLYTASGSGVSAMFRPHRDPGMVYDSKVYNPNLNGTLGFDLGAGALFKLGTSIKALYSHSKTGRWQKDNALAEHLYFKGSADVSDRDYEPYFFKQVGDLAVDRDNMYNQLGKDKALKVKVTDNNRGRTYNQFVDRDGISYSSSNYQRTERAPRNTHFQMLTAEEASVASLNQNLLYFSQNQFNYTNGELVPLSTPTRLAGLREAHHFSAATITQSNGRRDVYDLPVYNWIKEEVQMNLSGNSIDCEGGLISYNPGGANPDNSIDNDNGKDHFYNKVTTPAYVSSLLKTATLSSDYVDVTGDGITEDDLGTAIQYNYFEHHDRFKWRAPFQANMASYSPGFESRSWDDKGSYIYGERQQMYIHSIEGPFHVAEFRYHDNPFREDGFGVIDQNGGLDPAMDLLALEEIVIYAKKERAELGNQAVPVQTVRFIYDDSFPLCDGIPNNVNGNGKLTLTEIQTFYGDDRRNCLNPYKFFYGGDDQVNEDYGLKTYDRWGNFKPNSCANGLPNWKYPYVDQQNADEFADNWLLTSILTPSGSEIKVSYEAHDYSSVQNRKPMEMFKILGFRANPHDPAASNTLFLNTGGNNYIENSYMLIQLRQTVADDDAFIRRFLTDEHGKQMEEIYFNCKIAIDEKKDGQTRVLEQMQGFAFIEGGGLIGTNSDIGWVKLRDLGLRKYDDTRTINSLSKEVWQQIRLNFNEHLFDGANLDLSADSDDDLTEAFNVLGSFFMELKAAFTGFYPIMKKKHFANEIVPEESFTRLYSPNGFKKGGPGFRVCLISNDDGWTDINPNGITTLYGQKYDYTMEHPVTGEVQSSGCAKWEPFLGVAENPFFEPLRFKKKQVWTDNHEYFFNKPLFMAAYDAPGVGYEKVRISSIAKPGVTQNTSGFVEKYFYTARHFPTIVEDTDLDSKGSSKYNPFKIRHEFRASQGYLAIRNNMHGKPWKEYIFPAGADTDPTIKALSGMEYVYRTKNAFNPSHINRLDNEFVTVIDPDHTMDQAHIGIEMDLLVEERESIQLTAGLNTDGNLDGLLALFLPIPIPNIIPSPVFSRTQARFISTTKMIHQYGLLKETHAFKHGSKIKTENIAYDGLTGGIMLSRTENQYGQNVHNYRMPAHFKYSGMDLASHNSGISWEGSGNLDLSNLPDADDYLHEGDELLIDNQIGWVMATSPDQAHVVDAMGNLLPNTGYSKIKVIRSGHRNMASVPIGTVSSLDDPTDGTFMDFQDVLSSSAATYDDGWQLDCGPADLTITCDPLDYSLTQDAEDLGDLLSHLASTGNIIGTDIDITSFATQFSGDYLSTWDDQGSTLITCTGSNSPLSTPPQINYTLHTYPNGVQSPFLSFTLNDANGSGNPMTDICNLTSAALLVPGTVNTNDLSCPPLNSFEISGQTSCPSGPDYDYEVYVGNNSAPMASNPGTITSNNNCIQIGETVNPYLKGIKGVWLADRNHTFRGGRTHGGLFPLSPVDVDQDGRLENFNFFWQWNPGIPGYEESSTNWQWLSEITKRTPNGQEVENMDPLGRYSSAIWGYNQEVPIAVASNAPYSSIAVADFEFEEDLTTDCQKHLNLQGVGGIQFTDTESHTGKQSAHIFNTESVLFIESLIKAPGPCTNLPDPADHTYEIDDCDCAGVFAPIAGEDYLIRMWVKDESYNNGGTVGTGVEDVAEFYTNSISIVPELVQTTKAIDGWRLYSYQIHIPISEAGGALTIRIGENLAGSKPFYMDDFSFQPLLSAMTKNVYDVNSLRVIAQIDDNGFARIFNYSESGELRSIKQETQEGILTLEEHRQNLPEPQ